MTLAYISLLINVISGLFSKNNKALFFGIIITNLIGLYLGITTLEGFSSLVLLAAIIFLYSNFNPKNKIVQATLFTGIIAIIIGLG